MPDDMTQNDHDLLIVVHTKLDELIVKVDKLTDDHERRIRVLEETTADKKEVESLKKTVYMMSGGLALIAFLAPYFWSLVK